MTELARRYVVMPLATDAPFDPADPDGAFVLKPWKDPAALRALRAYRDSCFPELRRDLDAWIHAIESGPTVRGDIGRRNEPFVRAASAAGPPVAADSAATAHARKTSGTARSRSMLGPERAGSPPPAVRSAAAAVRARVARKGASPPATRPKKIPKAAAGTKRPAASGKVARAGRASGAGTGTRAAAPRTRGPAPRKPPRKRAR
jgi:hypothetical protein